MLQGLTDISNWTGQGKVSYVCLSSPNAFLANTSCFTVLMDYCSYFIGDSRDMRECWSHGAVEVYKHEDQLFLSFEARGNGATSVLSNCGKYSVNLQVSGYCIALTRTSITWLQTYGRWLLGWILIWLAELRQKFTVNNLYGKFGFLSSCRLFFKSFLRVLSSCL